MPWERIHVDFAGPIFEHTFFLIVDAHSKWLEVYPMKDKLRRDNFEFRDRKFDVGDRVAVRVYRAANTRWKFGTIVNQDGILHYIIDVQGTLVRRHVDQIRPVGDKVQENIIPLMHQRFPSSEVREKTTLIFSMQKRRKIFLRIGTRNWVHLPYKECHQLMLRFQIYHSLQLKRLIPDERPPVPDRPFT
ncbi:uncharacterized protein K02A2.6 [Trichonephila clavipes]|nr:uncharacterized protein K02A2.6 [Trichonephila clavipes]